METVLLSILSKSKKSDFISQIKLGAVQSELSSERNQIIPMYNLSNLNNEYNFEKFQNILLSFNNLDFVIEEELKIRNAQNTLLS
jgi:hypothetical protein